VLGTSTEKPNKTWSLAELTPWMTPGFASEAEIKNGCRGCTAHYQWGCSAYLVSAYLDLSRLIYSHRILFILIALHYLCGQPNRWMTQAHASTTRVAALHWSCKVRMLRLLGSPIVRLCRGWLVGRITPGQAPRVGSSYLYFRRWIVVPSHDPSTSHNSSNVYNAQAARRIGNC